jgi:hypothetical protein
MDDFGRGRGGGLGGHVERSGFYPIIMGLRERSIWEYEFAS